MKGKGRRRGGRPNGVKSSGRSEGASISEKIIFSHRVHSPIQTHSYIATTETSSFLSLEESIERLGWGAECCISERESSRDERLGNRGFCLMEVVEEYTCGFWTLEQISTTSASIYGLQE